MLPTITRDDLWTAMQRGDRLALVEALGADYFADAHLPGAVNMPAHRVDALAPVLLPDPSVLVVVYCSTVCTQSEEVAQRLLDCGYADVRVYMEGKEDWIEAGLPVERGPGRS